MIERVWLFLGGVFGLMAVAAGAYASHGIADPAAVQWTRTASEYQAIHALALTAAAVLSALAARRSFLLTAAGWLFIAGVVLFCGSLYVLALTGDRGLAAAAPVGGIALMLGWLALAAGGLAWRPRSG